MLGTGVIIAGIPLSISFSKKAIVSNNGVGYAKTAIVILVIQGVGFLGYWILKVGGVDHVLG